MRRRGSRVRVPLYSPGLRTSTSLAAAFPGNREISRTSAVVARKSLRIFQEREPEFGGGEASEAPLASQRLCVLMCNSTPVGPIISDQFRVGWNFAVPAVRWPGRSSTS